MRNLILTFLLAAVYATAAPILTVLPGGSLSGNGETKGWGVRIQNDASGWLLVSSVQLAASPAPVGTLANFADLLSPWVSANSRAIAPNELFQLNWQLNTQGLGEFTFPSSPFGYAGPTVPIVVTFDTFDDDPFVSGNYLASGELRATVDLSVSDPGAGAPIPEPATVLLFATGVALIALRRVTADRSEQQGGGVR